MKLKSVGPMTLAAVLAWGGPWAAVGAEGGATASGQIVILMFDDVVGVKSPNHETHGEVSKSNPAILERWQRLDDYLEQNHMKGAFGIICESLEGDNQAYCDWIKTVAKRGNIEFWLHGYKDRVEADQAEFEQPYAVQFNALARAESLAKEKLGFPLAAFGPHWSGSNADTEKALDRFPEITIRLGTGPKSQKRFTFDYGWRLEFPTQNPDFEKFKAGYENDFKDKPSLYIFCGHPMRWDDGRWLSFVKAMEYLRARGCRFMTPSEFVAHERWARK